MKYFLTLGVLMIGFSAWLAMTTTRMDRVEIGVVCAPRALDISTADGYNQVHALAMSGSFDDRYTAIDDGPGDCHPGEIQVVMERVSSDDTPGGADGFVGVVFTPMGDVDRSNFDPTVVLQP